MAVHPGAFVRGMRQVPDDDYDLANPVGFEVVYDLVGRASQHLAQVTAAPSGGARLTATFGPGRRCPAGDGSARTRGPSL